MHTNTTTSTWLVRYLSALCAVWLTLWVTLGGISIERVSAASSWSPTLIVNTEAFQSIDDSDTTANIVLRFGETINKTLTYNRSLARFQFDDDLYILGNLDTTGTVSGATLYGTKSLRSSGSLVFEGAASGSSLYLGTSLQGAGLADCDTGATSKLLWDGPTGRFSCGTDQTGGSTTLQAAYDNDVDGSDVTITQGLADDSIIISNPAALGTNSAFMLQLDQNATVAGEAIAVDIDSESTGTPAIRIDIAGDSNSPHLSFGQGGTFDTNLYRSTTNTLRTDDNLIVDTNVGIGTTDLGERLEVQGTASGTTIYGNAAVRSSGSLVWEGAASGNTLSVSGNATFAEDITFGDAIGDAITVNAAAWTFANDTNFALSGGVNALSFDTSTFSVDATADRIGIGTTAPDTTLEVIGTMSGQVIYGNNSLRSSGALVFEGAGSGNSLYIANYTRAGRSLASSGTLVWEGAASGNTLFVSGNATFAEDLTFGDAIGDAITVNAGTWTFANATNFAVTNAVNAFSVDTDTLSVDALNNRIGIRTTAPENPLEVVGTISGTALKITNGISASGSIVTELGISGATLNGFGLYDCDAGATSKLLWDAATGRFSCGTDQTGGAGAPEVGTASFSGGVIRLGDARYVNTSGDTMTGALTIDLSDTGNGTGMILREKAFFASGAILSGSLVLRARSDPGTPTNGDFNLYTKKIAGRTMLKGKGPSGIDYPYQPSFFQNQIIMISAGGGTAVSTLGSTTTNSATLSHPAADQTFGYMTNFATSTTSGNESGLMTVATPFFRGSTAGANGFFFNARVGVVDTTLLRAFVGLSSQTSLANQMASDDVTGSRAGFAFSTVRGDTNWQVTFKDGTTQNLVNSGVAFTANKVYDLFLFCSPQCTTMYWRVDNVTDNTTAEGSTATNLPAGATAMKAFIGVETQVAGAKNLRMQRIYVESDR